MIHTRSGRECVLSLAFVSMLAAACTTSASQVQPDSGVGSGGMAGKAGSGGKAGAGGTAGKTGSGGQAGGGGIAGATGSGGQAGSGGIATGSGGSGSGGSGSGGYMGPPVPNGKKPTTYSPADAQAAYDAWKTKHLINCNNGKFRVAWEDGAKAIATVSEGIGYGMLLTVAYNDQTAFNGLWEYYKAAKDGNGLMNWLRYDCDVSRRLDFSQYPDGAATDADLDAAMALIMANCRWGGGNYANDANTLLTAIKNHEVISESGRYLLLPGDSTWFHQMNGGCLNPSYFAPAYYRVFANFVSSSADKTFWNQLATDTYVTLGAGQNTSTGLVRNWTNTTGGTSACASSYNCPDKFGDDAVRTPWRIATDYVWYGTAEAKTFLDRMTGWAKNTVGIGNLQTWYTLEGAPGACTTSGRVISVGSFACGAMAYDQATVDAFAAEMKTISDPNYFERTLRALYSLLLTGQFTSCGNKP